MSNIHIFVIPVAIYIEVIIGVASSAALIIVILIIVIVVLSVLVIRGRKLLRDHQCTCQGSFSSKCFPTFEVSNN